MNKYKKIISPDLVSLVFRFKLQLPIYSSLDDLKNYFRIEHGLLIDVNFDYNAGKKFVIIITKMNAAEEEDNTYHISGMDFEPMFFDDYFIALEIGLFEAFKVISNFNNCGEIEKCENNFLSKLKKYVF